MRDTSSPSQSQAALDGVIHAVTFHSPDTGWTVARLAVDGSPEPVPVVGTMLTPEVGESVRLFGSFQKHERYGMQFRFERYQLVRPATARAIEAYLGGGLVEGVGPKTAEKLVAHFGDQTLDLLEHSPERVQEAPGIGRVRARALREAWERHRNIHRIMVFLHEHGIAGALAGRIYARYGGQAIEIIERRPFSLARDVRGIGFLTADRIARAVGIGPEDPSRIEAGILHALHMATGEGHLYLPLDTLLQRAQQYLGVSVQLVEMGIDRLAQANEVSREDFGGEMAVYTARLYETEMEVASRLCYYSQNNPLGVPGAEDIAAFLKRREAMGELSLSADQVAAVAGALRHGLSIITGGPGTGKTTVTRAIVDGCRAMGRPVALASPTGRAAKRLQQLAGHDASTIHRLLAYDPIEGGFRHGVGEPLPVGMLIIDEASMLDALLARDVLRAMPAQGQLVLIGDADQLPSVGPGSILRDMVNSGAVPTYRLTEIFRQAAESDIIRSAHLLNHGEAPRFVPREKWVRERGDCVLLEEEDVDAAADRVVRTATDSLAKLGFSPRDVQVITPVHRGPIGVTELNRRLQEAINPAAQGKTEVRRGDTVFRQADRILQVVNDYDKGVFNGDVGFVVEIDGPERVMRVEFDLATVDYPFTDLDELELAYALTVHKSQGSEYPAVVIVVHATHYIMLQRNLLYTALTRAKQMACIVGNQRGIWRAIRNVTERDRHTRLCERLRGQLPARGPTPGLPI